MLSMGHFARSIALVLYRAWNFTAFLQHRKLYIEGAPDPVSQLFKHLNEAFGHQFSFLRFAGRGKEEGHHPSRARVWSQGSWRGNTP